MTMTHDDAAGYNEIAAQLGHAPVSATEATYAEAASPRPTTEHKFALLVSANYELLSLAVESFLMGHSNRDALLTTWRECQARTAELPRGTTDRLSFGGSVRNEVSGPVRGSVVQAGDVHGGLTMGWRPF